MYISELASYLIPVMAVLMLSVACAMVMDKGTFSTNTFLVSNSIGICVLVWANIFPIWAMVIAGLLISVVLFVSRKEDVIGA